MTDRELRRLSREELLEILIEERKENDRLQSELENASAAANTREIRIQESGSLAKAALEINDVFESADAAAKQYLENIRAMQDETREKCDRMIQDARDTADQIIKAALRKAGGLPESPAAGTEEHLQATDETDDVDSILWEFNTEQYQN